MWGSNNPLSASHIHGFSPRDKNTMGPAIYNHPTYVALVKDKDTGRSHGHRISAGSTVSQDMNTNFENRPRHMNLHYIIRIK